MTRIPVTRVTSLLILLSLQRFAVASPACVNPDAKNFVLASTKSNLADAQVGQWLLQSVDSNDRILLRRCSERSRESCYFATDIKPGRYYFQQVVPTGKNDMLYPVSTDKLWFTITGMGVDYLGRWVIERPDLRVVTRLEVHYELTDLDEMLALCEIKNRKLYLNRTRSPANQIVD